jgi:outer membrane lipoprotein-sorting protein
MQIKNISLGLLLVVICITIFASGCTEDTQDIDEITNNIRDAESNIQDYSCIIHMTFNRGEQVEEIEYNTTFKKPDMLLTVATKPNREIHSIRYLDGTYMWTYIPNTNTAIKIPISKVSEPLNNDYTMILDRILNNTNLSLPVEGNFDGKETYLLEATPKGINSSSELSYKTKIWVDKETWLPLKYEIYNNTEHLVMKLEIQNLKVNTGVSDFKFEIPENTTILDLDK